MPITTNTPTIPAQRLQTGDVNALKIEQFTGRVEGTIRRESRFKGWVRPEIVRQTNNISVKAIGSSSLQRLVRGQAPDGAGVDFNKVNLLVDVPLIDRKILWAPDELQNDFDAKMYIADEQGKNIAKYYDNALLIQASKAALATTSAFGAVDGHFGGSQETLAASGDLQDPAKLYAAFANLFAKMMAKDVDPIRDGVVIAVPPAVFMTLLQAEQVSNGEYVNAQGTKVTGGWVFNAFGVPVVSTNDLPQSVISGHLLSTTANSNAFDGDFTKLGALVWSPRAILVGETESVSTTVFFHEFDKHTYVDSWLMFSACPLRNEYAGAILLP